MAEDFRKTLSDDPSLDVIFVVDSGVARVEFKSDSMDLSSTDDVVAVLDGRGLEVIVESENAASATIGEWSELEDKAPQLMVRVHEFFEGWQLNQ